MSGRLITTLQKILAWVYKRIYNYQIGRYYWWNWIAVIYGFVDAKVVYWLYRVLDPDHWARERSVEEMAGEAETLFIMGSGGSVNDISDSEWETMEQVGDVMSFNYFFRGEFVPVDFHIAREFSHPPAPLNMSMLTSRKNAAKYIDDLLKNPMFNDAKLFVNKEPPRWSDRAAVFSLWATYFRKDFAGRDICFYQADPGDLPGEDVFDITHIAATLTDAINLGYLMGYENIVLVGVDLYNREYFWLDCAEARDTDKRRGTDVSTEHRTASPVVKHIDRWDEYLRQEGVHLYVENPKSLVHTQGNIPVYDLGHPPTA